MPVQWLEPRIEPVVTLSQEQQQVVEQFWAERPSAMLIAGRPGTGRSNTLVEMAARHVADQGSVAGLLVVAATRPDAQKLRNRVVRRVGGTQLAPKVMTGHSLARSIVNLAHPDQPLDLMTAPEQEFRLRELLAGHDTSTWPADLRRASGTRAFAGEVRAAMARVRQLGLDPGQLASIAAASNRPEWVLLAGFLEEYLDVVDATGSVDYAELVHRARLALLEPSVAQPVAEQTQLVLVDDIEELDPSQVDLLADLVANGSGLVAATDPATRVFGFRGADGRVAIDFDELFGVPGRPAPIRRELVRDHVHARAVAEALATIDAKLPRDGASAVAVPERPEIGKVEAWVVDGPGAEAAHIVDAISQLHLDAGVAHSDIAVISRSHRGGLMALARALTGAGIPVQLDHSDLALRESVAVRPLLLGLSMVLDLHQGRPIPPDEAVSVLRSPLGGLDAQVVRRLGRLLRHRGAEWATLHWEQAPTPQGIVETDDVTAPQRHDGGPEPAGPPITSAQWLAETLVHPELLDQIVPEAPDEPGLAHGLGRLRALGALLGDLAGRMDSAVGADEVLWELWSSTGWPERLRAAALEQGDQAAAADRDLDAISALFDLAARDANLLGARGVRHLLDEVESHQIPSDTERESQGDDRGVNLVTAHRAKGRSWPVVFVCQVQEGRWPATVRRRGLLEVDRLTRTQIGEPEPLSRVVADERRVFLAACTAATDHLVVTASQGHEGEGDQRSRFLDELGVPVQVRHGRPSRPLTFPAMVANLRAVAADPGRPSALRSAAAARLARLRQLQRPDGSALVPLADPHRWWAMRPFTSAPSRTPDQPLVFHGSELADLLGCPRRWFLARRARAEAGRTAASGLGSVIHTLMEHAEDPDLDQEQLQEHLESVWTSIQFDAAWLSASETVEAEAALDRFNRWRATSVRTVLGTEVDFDVTIELDRLVGPDAVRGAEPLGPHADQVRLTGSVDRLEVDVTGGLHIVDFKLGRSRPTQAQVDQDPQLGTYQLAALAGGFDRIAGPSRPVAGAELVYLRHGDDGYPQVFTQAPIEPGGEQTTLHGAGTGAETGEDGAVVDGDLPNGGYRTWMHQVLARAAAVVASDSFPATRNPGCMFCPFRVGCPAHSTLAEVAR